MASALFDRRIVFDRARLLIAGIVFGEIPPDPGISGIQAVDQIRRELADVHRLRRGRVLEDGPGER